MSHEAKLFADLRALCDRATFLADTGNLSANCRAVFDEIRVTVPSLLAKDEEDEPE